MTDSIQVFPPWVWIAFLAFISAMLAIDLGLFHREVRAVRMKEALGWCTVWVSLALTFNLIVYLWRGLEFLTGYLIDLSLSVDNAFGFPAQPVAERRTRGGGADTHGIRF